MKVLETIIDSLDTKNINKKIKVKKLSKKLKRLQRQCSKKYIINKKGESFHSHFKEDGSIRAASHRIKFINV
ncbi:hypothetical protein [Clostridium tetani]|uniref:hypothetical protein n=1 Tax=Clostridium tetani TaxID=1513 RepID=UPI0038B304FD